MSIYSNFNEYGNIYLYEGYGVYGVFVITLCGKECIFEISNSINVQSFDINKILYLSLT